MMLAGAIPAALLAVGFDAGLAALQRLMKPGANPQTRRGGVVAALVAVPFLLGFSFWPGQRDKLIAGFAHEFYGRADGYPGLKQTYGLNLRPRLIDQSLMYEAIHHEQVDIISGYSTDGRIRAFDLLVLTDNRHAFPPYDAAPVIRQATLDRHPELGPTLDLLAGKLTDAVMTDLNYRADYLHQSPERIAHDFLVKTRLLKTPTPGKNSASERTEIVVIGSKVFTEQYILSEIYRQLIEGHTRLRVITKTGLGGTQICFDALRTGAIDFYPEYTGTGLLVILQPPADSLKKIPMQAGPVFDFVSREFQKKYGLRWGKPLGFSNSYCLMMRRKQAESLATGSISELVRYLRE
jgi:osmoprotectant transport system permease protein